MNWEIIGSIGDFIGGIVIVVSIVYLAAQFRQSNRHAEATSQVAWIDSWNRALNDLVSDEATQNAIRAGLQDFDSLDKTQQAIFHMRVGSLINLWLLAGELCSKNLLSDTYNDGCTDFVVSILSTPGGLSYWKRDAKATPRGEELLEMVLSDDRDVPPFDQLLPWWSKSDA